MNINHLPVIGWLLSFLLQTIIAVPFWFLWTYLQYGKRFFSFLPLQFINIEFWDCVALFMIFSILKSVLLPSFRVTNEIEEKENK